MKYRPWRCPLNHHHLLFHFLSSIQGCIGGIQDPWLKMGWYCAKPSVQASSTPTIGICHSKLIGKGLAIAKCNKLSADAETDSALVLLIEEEHQKNLEGPSVPTAVALPHASRKSKTWSKHSMAISSRSLRDLEHVDKLCICDPKVVYLSYEDIYIYMKWPSV